jgi:hypothetical protein
MPRNSVNWPVRTQSVLALCAALALSACASKYSQIPPRLDLAPMGRVALVTFAADQQSAAEMGSLATQRFAETLLANQPGVELLEIDAADSSLRSIPANDAHALAKALGRTRGVDAVFVGYLKVSGMKPRGQLSPAGMKVRATVSAELSVRLLATRTGGTTWRSSAVADGTVGRLAMSGGLPSVAVRDQEEAYGEVVHELVAGVTRDLRPTWVKQ